MFRQHFIPEIGSIPSRESNCAIIGNACETIVRRRVWGGDEEECRTDRAAAKEQRLLRALGHVARRSLLFAERSSGEVSRRQLESAGYEIASRPRRAA